MNSSPPANPTLTPSSSAVAEYGEQVSSFLRRASSKAEGVAALNSYSSSLLENLPACTDSRTKPWVQEAGIEVLDQPFIAHGNVATAGGCLSSHYLAAWVIARLAGWKAAESVVHYVAPVGQKQEYVDRALGVLKRYLPEQQPVAAA